MFHIALCCIALLLCLRYPSVRQVAVPYIAIQGFFWLIRSDAEYYGEGWWYLVAIVEAMTAICMIGINHWAARFVAWVSWSAVVINIACIPSWSPVYGIYSYLIPCSEFARIACIIIASPPIWQPLLRWHESRQARKPYKWLAKSIPTCG